MEALILYFVLFFPALYTSPFPGIYPEVLSFSILKEIGRTLTYTIPALALLWYIISDKNDFFAIREEKPKTQDLIQFALGLPSLVVIGLGISLLITYFAGSSGLSPPPKVEAPVNIAGWIVLVFSCLGTGYLEESYFRYYLLTRLAYALPNSLVRILLSTALFAVCHIYEGPWGILNAVLAGALLSAFFIRFRSLHGLAWSHGVYNIFVYVMGLFIQ